jgi:uncharacterized protein (DUF849 family)
MLLQAAINGARAPESHPALPVSAAQFAAAASAAIRSGAGEVHLHVRQADGRESLHPAPVADIISAVRQACPAPLGISTGGWIESDPDRRLALVSQWRVRPDFASVNFDEPGAAELAQSLIELGVGVEAGVANVAAAEVLAGSGLLARCLRVLLEPSEDDLSAASTTVSLIEQILERRGYPRPWLLHGTGPTTWPLLSSARARGYDTRIGLEDTLLLPDGRVARDNAELVAAAMVALELEAPQAGGESAR